MTYRVTNWAALYENNRSRKVKLLGWVPIPNRHDGEGYSLIMATDDAAEIFSAWVLILQVASRCHPRGTLLRADGKAHTPESLAIKTRARKEWFQKAFKALLEVAWIEVVEGSTHDDGTVMASPCHCGDEEGKGREWKEGNGMGGNGSAPAMEECKDMAKKLGMPESEGEAFFRHYNAIGWVNGAGVTIMSWSDQLHRWKSKWENGFRKGPNSSQDQSGPTINSIAQADSVIGECDRQIKALSEKRENKEVYQDDRDITRTRLKSAAAEEVKKLRSRIEEVRKLKSGLK